MKIHYWLLSAPIIALLAAEPALAEDVSTAPNKWAPELQLETDVGIGHNSRDIGLPQMQIPLWQNNDSMVFSDLRYRFDDEQSEEYNLGLGYRKEINNNWILGGYGFFDKLDSASGNYYSQATFGAEALSVNNDARVNVYIPQSTVHGAPGGGTVEIVGNQIGIEGGEERALPGEDFELGQKLPLNFADVRVYGGGYRYTADNFGMESGPRGRLELTLNDQYIPEIPFGAEVTVGGEIEHDQVRGTNSFAVLKLRIPFGGEVKKSTNTLDERMNTFIQRDVDVIEKSGNGGNGALQPVELNGATITNVVNINNTSDFSATVNGASAGTLFLLNGSVNYGSNIAASLKAGQALVGDGTTIAFNNTKGSIINYTIPGAIPSVTGGGSNANIDMANNSSMQNIVFSNIPLGIFIEGVSNVTLSHVNINNTVSNGVNVIVSNNVVLSNVDIANVANIGLYIYGVNNLTASNIVITSPVFTGVQFNASEASQNIIFSGISVDNSTTDAIGVVGLVATNLSINNAHLTNINGSGASGFDFTNSTITNLSGTGNTYNGTGSGGACSSALSTITGSITYNGGSTCP